VADILHRIVFQKKCPAHCSNSRSFNTVYTSETNQTVPPLRLLYLAMNAEDIWGCWREFNERTVKEKGRL